MTNNTSLRIASLLPFLCLASCSDAGSPPPSGEENANTVTGTTGDQSATGTPTTSSVTGTTGVSNATTGASTTTMGGVTGSGGATTTGGTVGMGGATTMGGVTGMGGSLGAGGASAGTEGTTGSGGGTSGGNIHDFVEDPGANCPVGEMPAVASLTDDPKLPDPFTKMDGTQMTSKAEWVCRREEILQEGYEFIYGEKPRTPMEAVSGSVSNTMISVQVNDGGSTSFSVTVSLPNSGSAPYPAVIGFGNVAFASELGSRGIATINYNAYSVGAENGGSAPGSGAFYDVYGANHSGGLLVAWAWGISRIIDVLEQDPTVIDPTKIGVTGCSRFGKGAFVTGVLDNRIALTVPVESGVGGTPALRLIGDLDSSGEWPYHAISYQPWFSPSQLGQFATANNAGGDTTDRLPVDMHEMIGLVAPRGLYIVDNPSTNYAGLNRNAAWVTANVGAKIYEALGVPDNITYQGASGGHCQWRSQYTAPLVANVEKFLLGDESAGTGTFDTDFSGPNPDSHYDWSVPTLSGDL